MLIKVIYQMLSPRDLLTPSKFKVLENALLSLYFITCVMLTVSTQPYNAGHRCEPSKARCTSIRREIPLSHRTDRQCLGVGQQSHCRCIGQCPRHRRLRTRVNQTGQRRWMVADVS